MYANKKRLNDHIIVGLQHFYCKKCLISSQTLSYFSLSIFSSLEMLDKVEPPSIPEGYAMSVAFSALLDLVRGITSMIERELAMEEEAAAEFREAHPDQEWKAQAGENRPSC